MAVWSRVSGGGRVRRGLAALVVAVATAVAVFAFPATSGADVTAVRGSAYGYFASVSLFGGPPNVRGPEPSVTLPATGSAVPITASAPSGLVQVGPAVLFSSGPITVSTQGTLGPSGSVTSTSTIQNINTSGNEIFTATAASSTCTATETGVTGSTTITNGTLRTGGGNVANIPANPAPNTTYTGTVDGVGDNFRAVFNEQVVNPDGSITVNAYHLYLLGPTAVGDLIVGQSVCGVTATQTTTTTAPTTTTTAPTTTTTAPTTTTTGGQNRPPVANNDAYTTPQGTTLTVPAPGVLANDSDPDGDPLTAGMPTNPSNGTLNLSTNGGFTYTPNPGFTGVDSFTYMAHDPNGGMTTATVTITVTATTTTTTAPTTTTTAPTTTTTAPTTTTTAPTTTTTAPTTTTTAPTTTTTAPTTTTTAPTTTTTAPTTTTTAPGALTCDGLTATIVGTPGDDRITGTPERDVIVALGGHDMVHGMGGDDVICGGPGDDHLNGGQGNDRLFGGDGDDVLVGAAGTDHHDGGRGEDVCGGGGGDTFSDCERGQAAMQAASSAGGRSVGGIPLLVGWALLVAVALRSGRTFARRPRRS